jgi:hypothetical protein
MGTAVIASLLTSMLWIATHLAAMHIRPARNRMAAMAKSYLLSLPVLLVLIALLNHCDWLVSALNRGEDPLLSWFYSLLLQLLFFFLFVECFYHIERSVTLRLLVEIQALPREKSVIGVIMKDYSVDDMIRRRLDDMARNDFVRKAGQSWVLSPKGETMAKFMSFSCWIFQSKPQNERL